MEKTWMPTVAGILNIVSASFKLIAVLGLIIGMIVIGSYSYIDPTKAAGWCPVNVFAVMLTITIYTAITGILAMVGGIYPLQRKRWGLALAGSIAAFFPVGLLGAAAIVFTALSKRELE
ncbi:hypothetical protein ACFLWG_02675 [Chloroflexota bacterium]